MKISDIAIVFGDNDFYPTFSELLKAIGGKVNDQKIKDKQTILKVINSSVVGYYRTFQNPYQYADDWDDNKAQSYLQIREDQLLINEEVIKYQREKHFSNGEVFCVQIVDRSMINVEYDLPYIWTM